LVRHLISGWDMAPYIEAIDSQHSFYFTVSRHKSTTYICLKIRLFCTTQTIVNA